MKFDLQSLDVSATSEAGFDVHIVNPKTREVTGMVWKIQGAFSARFQELLAKQKKKEALRAKSPVARAVSEEEDETPALLAEASLNWGTVDEKDPAVVHWGEISEGDKAIKFSRGEAQRVLQQYVIVRGQVLAACMDVGNFIKD